MKNVLIALALSAHTLHADVQLLKSEPTRPATLNIGYLSLTDDITDFNEVVKKIKLLAQDSDVAAIILHINSPGGSPGSSQIIADFICWAKQLKPIIAFISDSGTSGAYWVAAACTHIIAPESALIGSIGVASELPTKNKTISFTAGKFKRTHYLADGVIDPEHVDAIQQRIDCLYDIFCNAVAQLRDLDVAVIKGLEAHVYLGTQALELGLIDQIGTFKDLFEAALELTKTRSTEPVTIIRLIESPDEVLEFTV